MGVEQRGLRKTLSAFFPHTYPPGPSSEWHSHFVAAPFYLFIFILLQVHSGHWWVLSFSHKRYPLAGQLKATRLAVLSMAQAVTQLNTDGNEDL